MSHLSGPFSVETSALGFSVPGFRLRGYAVVVCFLLRKVQFKDWKMGHVVDDYRTG